MAFWEGWFGRKASDPAANSLDVLREIMRAGNGTASGKAVNWNSALELATVWACTRVIAEGVAQVPVKIFREANGSRTPATDHPLYTLLHRRPNDWQTSFEYCEQMAIHLVLAGNHFTYVSRDVMGRPLELLPLEPGWVTVKRDTFGAPPTYTVRPLGRDALTLGAGDIWHVRGPSWNGWAGLDGVRQAREAIGLGKATEEFGAKFFANGARPGGLLVAPPGTGTDVAEQLKDAWLEANQGSSNAMKTILVGGGIEFKQLAQTPEEAQFIETRRHQVEEVCRAFRVMPIMIGFTDKTATYASAEQMFLAHVVHTLMPWFERIAQSAEVNLLTPEERTAGYYVKFLPNGLLRGAAKDRADFYAKALGAGGSPAWMTQDEVRALEELNPMGGSAAELAQPTNVGTQSKPADPAEAEQGA